MTAGTPPAEGAALPRVELVSQGEFLAAAAGELGRAGSEVQRDLRLFVIGANLKPFVESDGSALARALAAFAEAGWWAIGTGAAAAEPERFVDVVSDAAAALRGADAGNDRRVAQMLEAHARRLLLRLSYPPPVVPAAPIRPAAAPIVAALPVAAAPAVVRSTAFRPLPPTVPTEGGGLAASWSTLEALIAERGLARGPLEELLAAPTTLRVSAAAPVREAAMPAAALAVPATAAGPPIVPIESLAPGEPDVVPIESLLYDGDGARGRLREVQGELEAALATAGTSPQVRALLGEVFDLIGLGLHTTR